MTVTRHERPTPSRDLVIVIPFSNTSNLLIVARKSFRQTFHVRRNVDDHPHSPRHERSTGIRSIYVLNHQGQRLGTLGNVVPTQYLRLPYSILLGVQHIAFILNFVVNPKVITIGKKKLPFKRRRDILLHTLTSLCIFSRQLPFVVYRRRHQSEFLTRHFSPLFFVCVLNCKCTYVPCLLICMVLYVKNYGDTWMTRDAFGCLEGRRLTLWCLWDMTCGITPYRAFHNH